MGKHGKVSILGSIMEFVDNSRAVGKRFNAQRVSIAFEPREPGEAAPRILVIQDDGVGMSSEEHSSAYAMSGGSFLKDGPECKYSMKVGVGVRGL